MLLLASATYFNLIALEALAFISLFIGSAVLTSHQAKTIRYFAWVAVTVLSLAFALHLIPGFHNPVIFHSDGLGTSALPFTLRANLDKAFAAIMILSLMIDRLSLPKLTGFLKADLTILIIGIPAILLVGYLMGLNLEPKIGQLTLAFAFFNLFTTCLAEEAFFRLLIQDSLWRRIHIRQAGLIAWSVSALLFTLAHFHTGPGAGERLFLIFLAALLYAGVYWRSRCFLSAVITHFLLNFLHLSFFTYPASFN